MLWLRYGKIRTEIERLPLAKPRFAKKWQSSRKSGQRSDWRERLSILYPIEQLRETGLIPFGRRTYQLMESFWPGLLTVASGMASFRKELSNPISFWIPASCPLK